MSFLNSAEYIRKIILVILLLEVTVALIGHLALIVDRRYLKQRRHILFFAEFLVLMLLGTTLVDAEWNVNVKNGCPVNSVSAFAGYHLSWVVILLAEIAFAIVLTVIKKDEIKSRENSITEMSIYEAFNDLPDGICVSRANGLPVLTNDRFYEVFEDLSGTLFRNAAELKPYINSSEPLILSDGSVWEFRQKEMMVDGEHMIETSAFDITRLYFLSKEIEAKNASLSEQNTRLVNLLGNIAAVQREEEILASRVRIHDELGQIILMTRKLIANEGTGGEDDPDKADYEDIIKEWDRVITMLGENMADVEPAKKNDKEALEHAAEAVGCKIHWNGELPDNDENVHLILQTVRETLMNAVHYGDASNVCVEMDEMNGKTMVTISDDGKGAPNGVTERGGLKNMRRKIESKGGIMEVTADTAVVITIVL